MSRVPGSLIVLFAAAGLGLADDPKVEEAREKKAAVNSQLFALAANAYRVKHMDWPEKLTDLTKPRAGLPPFVKAEPEDLRDPWGKDYKYEVAKDEKGQEKAYVWTEREVGGKTLVYGEKPPGKKDKK